MASIVSSSTSSLRSKLTEFDVKVGKHTYAFSVDLPDGNTTSISNQPWRKIAKLIANYIEDNEDLNIGEVNINFNVDPSKDPDSPTPSFTWSTMELLDEEKNLIENPTAKKDLLKISKRIEKIVSSKKPKTPSPPPSKKAVLPPAPASSRPSKSKPPIAAPSSEKEFFSTQNSALFPDLTEDDIGGIFSHLKGIANSALKAKQEDDPKTHKKSAALSILDYVKEFFLVAYDFTDLGSLLGFSYYYFAQISDSILSGPGDLSMQSSGIPPFLSSAGSGLLYFLTAVGRGRSLYHNYQFRKTTGIDELRELLKNPPQDSNTMARALHLTIASIEEMFKISPQELEDHLFKQFANQKGAQQENTAKIKEGCYQIAVRHGTAGLKKILKEIGRPDLATDAACKNLLDDLFTREQLVHKGRSLKLRELEIKKELDLSKDLGKTQVCLMKEACGIGSGAIPLSKRLLSPHSQARTPAITTATAAIEKIGASIDIKAKIEVAILLFALLGTIACIIFPPVGIPMFFTVFAFVLFYIVNDTTALVNLNQFLNLENFDPSAKRRFILNAIFNVVVLLATTTVALVLFSASPLNIVLAAIALTAFLGIAAYTFYAISQRQKKHEEDQLTDPISADRLREQSKHKQDLLATLNHYLPATP